LDGALVERGESFRELPSPLPFIDGGLPRCELLEAGDELVPVGDAAGADLAGNSGLEQLLGAAAADAEQSFERRAVDPRVGQGMERGDHGWQAAEPEGFIGHFPVPEAQTHVTAVMRARAISTQK
jgi:hypothetical protein